MRTENDGTIESNKNRNLSLPIIQQQQQVGGGELSPSSLKTCANISSPQLPNTSTTSTTATFSITSSPPPLVMPETVKIHHPTILMSGDQMQPYNSFNSPTVYYEVQQHPQPQMRKELHV
ncbi:hypothetical protein Mgra_00009415 [Meloidogyne graminicola]|uniref:Uncharacterized protein n=1 Tax=Meloidogyne graminicola TaxID=189291 RepID=A0A8S9Z9B8_9BILA|nr:hypothetical protein Mgra_00009415 [Meloidogyne graminicola]